MKANKNARRSKSFRIRGKFQATKADLLCMVWFLTDYVRIQKVDYHWLKHLCVKILGMKKGYIPDRMGYFIRLEGGKDPSGRLGFGYLKPYPKMAEDGGASATFDVALRQRARKILKERMTRLDRVKIYKRIVEGYAKVYSLNRHASYLGRLLAAGADPMVDD